MGHGALGSRPSVVGVGRCWPSCTRLRWARQGWPLLLYLQSGATRSDAAGDIYTSPATGAPSTAAASSATSAAASASSRPRAGYDASTGK
eukprot:9116966-Alexandrium_andersonii.AAC.1